MLDLDRRLVLPSLPDLLVYRDHERPGTYYVVPPAPALAVDGSGKPEARFLIYLERENGGMRPTGGQVSFTTLLTIPSAQTAVIREAIEAQLAVTSPLSGGPASGVDLAAPEWASGKVTVTLAENLQIVGQPSLVGENRCALMSSLTAEQAQAIHDKWALSLPDAVVAYEMSMRVVDTKQVGVQVREVTTETGPGSRSESVGAMDVQTRQSTAIMRTIAIRGGFWMDGLKQSLKQVNI